jgi:hypothetical protein
MKQEMMIKASVQLLAALMNNQANADICASALAARAVDAAQALGEEWFEVLNAGEGGDFLC